MKQPNHCARCPDCNQLVWICSDWLRVNDPTHFYAECAKLAKDGLVIERIETEAFRALPAGSFGHTDDCPRTSANKRRQRRREAAEKKQPQLFK
jgi:hypothetical protein